MAAEVIVKTMKEDKEAQKITFIGGSIKGLQRPTFAFAAFKKSILINKYNSGLKNATIDFQSINLMSDQLQG